jgi:hypothetical protein
MLSVVMLNDIMLSVVMLSVVMLNVIMLSVVMLSVIMLNVIMLNVVMLSVIMRNVVMLNVVMLIVIMLNGVMLNVVAPYLGCFTHRMGVLRVPLLSKTVLEMNLFDNISTRQSVIRSNVNLVSVEMAITTFGLTKL